MVSPSGKPLLHPNHTQNVACCQYTEGRLFKHGERTMFYVFRVLVLPEPVSYGIIWQCRFDQADRFGEVA